MTLFAPEPEQSQPDNPDTSESVEAANATMRRGLDRILDPFGSNDKLRLLAELRQYANATETQIIAEKRRQGATQRTIEKDIQDTSGAGRREAKERAERAQRLDEMPSVAEAFQEGRITTGQVDAITKAANDTSPEEVEQGGLLDQIENADPDTDQSRRLAKQWATQQDRNKHAEERAKRQRRNRKANIWTDRDTGMTILHAEFDPVTGQRIAETLLTVTR